MRAAELLEVPDSQVEDFQSGLLGRELAAVAGEFPQPGVHRLGQVRGVDDAPDLGRERRERGELGPVRPPQPDDRRVPAAPGAGQGLQGCRGGRLAARGWLMPSPRGAGQEIAAFTSSAIFFSTTGLHFLSA